MTRTEDLGASLRDGAKVIGWGLLLYGAVAFVGSKLATRSVGAVALQMVLAEWGAGRLAIAWSDPGADVPTSRDVTRRAGSGALIGGGAAVVATIFALATGALRYNPASPAAGPLGLAIATATLSAVRDELLLRGVTIRAFRRACSPTTLAMVCGGAAAAAEFGSTTAGEVHVIPVLAAGLLGVFFASLWLADRGAWLPVAAHAAWTAVTTGVIRGGVFDLRSAPGAWGGGDLGLSGSLALVSVLVPLSALSLAWLGLSDRRRHSAAKVG